MNFTGLQECGAAWTNDKLNGGYSNHPLDMGGETKYGISKKAYPNVDIKNLTKPDAISIYHRDYWLLSGADTLPFSLAACVFDTAVNMGVGRAKGFLTKSPDDWRQYIRLRREFYTTILSRNPSQNVWKNGWLARLQRLTVFVEEFLASQK